MRTTITLDDDVLVEARRLALATGRTLGQVVEDALRETLARRAEPRRRVELPTSKGGGWLRPGLDPDNVQELLDAVEGPDRPL